MAVNKQLSCFYSNKDKTRLLTMLMMVEDIVSRFMGLLRSSPTLALALIMAWSGWWRPKGMGWPPMCSLCKASILDWSVVAGSPYTCICNMATLTL